ncbi:transketolase [Methylotuvimicrobium buryatense]|uniref:Transketolase n=1 Tax=Methylotuvimicrobium buryatense TaxID=95641 RepID=A0A4P9UVR0_METBY|nr:transketolase [Methylotuvimicrobium buryatense]QCW84535.1 transketolase [Methylotuvimicrobium buryatense]QCW84537.1 transketolase [Methylotuvimicrobium buryatense]QCW84539.1 transketolase [Methylotuvimicrobium buryatense]QCW84541.1 transketolase [Methylotuvimicrobium buryatense]
MPSRRDLANAIRALSMDAVQKANSGHPGAPMGMADIAEVLWNDFLQHNPTNPSWANRDRFVLSNGHGSMLLYSLLHLTGYGLPIDELKQFRQLHSKTPGHPEYGYAPGVETTTGPLGQGITNAVGFAIAERALAGQFNRPGHEIVDHYTYAFLGDGCLMEGISHEACSLAGSMKLGKLIAVYDDNNISIDGEVRGHGDTPGWFLDDTPKRFEAYGWHVIPKVDGHNPEAVKKALEEARSVTDRPTLICCQTIIGWGSPNKEGKEECHGAALGEAEIEATRERIGWPHAPFEIPADIYAGWDAKHKGARQEAEWNDKFAKYQAAHPELAAEFERRMSGQLPSDWAEKSNAFIAAVDAKGETIASRKASQNTLNGFGPLLPELMGGSADLAGSNLTLWSGCKDVNAPGHDGNYVYYGVREFGMSAIMNGITLHGGFKPYGATFLMFSEYARNALRMAALMKIPTIFVYTHDSIGLGEDGPTHQPVEQTATLRMIPNMQVWRPCDAVESAVSWKAAIERNDGPSCLIFSRQNLAHIARTSAQIEAIGKGGYILKDSEGQPDVILIATGSEVELAVKAADELSGKGKKVRVVSMPSTNVFDAQDEAYRESVLPKAVTKRVVVEAGVTDSWWKYAGSNGCVIGLDRFGESAPAGALFKEFGFTVDNVVKHVEALL